jgi:multidrug resistance efflux pump
MAARARWYLTRVVVPVLLAAGAAAGVGAYLARGRSAGSAQAAGPEARGGHGAVAVKTVRPRRDPSFVVTVEQPAYVTAYNQVPLLARVAGPITMLQAAIGDRVRKGEELVRIDVPDLKEDVLQKEAVVKQRQRELELARANAKMAQAAVAAAAGAVREKEAAVGKAEAYRSFRAKERRRFLGLLEGNSPGITRDVVDEQEQQYETAVAAAREAEAAVQKAKADGEEARAKSEAAQADVNLKAALVDVAAKDCDRAKALFDLTSLRAPFDGVVVARDADPGTFVQNATTARAVPVLTVARTDIVTVYLKVPDNYAPYVRPGTDVVLELGQPARRIPAKVMRTSDTLETSEHDRTMRAEVDLFNGTAEEYQRFVARAKASGFADLKGRALPLFPEGAAKAKPGPGPDGRLLPGMFGTARLQLQKFADAFLVPSTALVSQGGRSFLYLVRDGRAVRVPVEVQFYDGREAKVALLERVGGQEVRRELTGDDVVVASNQGELADGQPVRAGEPTGW